ncbi:MAG: DUF2239 family protein, partial [Pseudomonadota bacterium]|nr:DUF2239 family protein [Pseudomonadota bacterium]
MYSTFNLARRIARGSLREAALAAHEHLHEAGVVIFDESTFSVVDVDLSGSAEDVARRIDSYPQSNIKPNRGRGRPKLGVIGREVTLLPRHWEWLAQQPGGASVTLRKLVSAARKDPDQQQQFAQYQAQQKAYRFCQAMAGDLQGYEDALRALYA